MATSSRSGGFFAAACAFVSTLVALCSHADTLAEWEINSNSEVNAQPSATTKANAISSAYLAMGSGVEAKDTANTFGGDNFDYTKNVTTSYESACSSGDYLEIDLTVASSYALSLTDLSYNIRRTSTGPSTFQWAYSTDGTSFTKIGTEENPTVTTATGNPYTLDLSDISNIPENSQIILRIVAWGAGGATGTFFFNKGSLTLTGTATETSGGGGEEPPIQNTLAIGEISDKGVSVGGTLSFPVTITVPAGMETATNVTTSTAGVDSSSFAIADGTFSYTPGQAHVTLSPVEFTITVSDASDSSISASETFKVAVSLPTYPLAAWTFGKSTSYTGDDSLDASSRHDAIAEAAILRGANAEAAGAQGVFGAKGFNTVSTFSEAQDAGKYLELSFTAAQNYTLAPCLLSYGLTRTSAGPTAAQWAVANGGTVSAIGEPLSFSETTFTGLELPLSSIGEVGKGETVTLRLYAWGASGSTGTFGLSSSMALSGYAEEDETVYVAPSLGPIGDFWSYVDATNLVALSIANDIGTHVTTNVTCSIQEVQGEYSITNGYFRYVPATADAALSPLEFTVALHVEAEGRDDVNATQTFSVDVYGRPAFVETFDDAQGKTSWGDETPASVVEVAATWSGTNYMVQGQANDNLVSGRALRLRNTGYIEMETASAKNGGASAVALWSGFYNHASGDATVTVSVSHKVGKIWGDWEEIGVVQIGSDLAYRKIPGLEYEGYVKLRLDWTATQTFNIDDIAIFDYGEPVEEPVEDTTVLPLVYGKDIEQGFDAIGEGATATLPSGWRVASAAIQDFAAFDFAEASSQTTKHGGLNISATADAGIYNVGTNPLDRAVGFLSSGKNTWSAALMVHLRNDGRGPIKTFELSYSVEQWRRGHGRQVALYTSTDGQTWTPAGAKFVTPTDECFDGNGKASGFADGELPEPLAVSGKLTLPASVPVKGEFYLGWFYSRVAGATDDGTSGQLLAVDDIVIHGGKNTIIMLH